MEKELKVKRMNFNIPYALYEELKKESEVTGLPMKVIFQIALTQYLQTKTALTGLEQMAKMVNDLKLLGDKEK